MEIYYARPISLYNTKQDERDIQTLRDLGFDVINPNKEELERWYKKDGMDVFLQAVAQCDALAFRSFLDGGIGSGVYAEIETAIRHEKPVIELPTITSKRVLSVNDTREYLKLLGVR
jgi:hypothetical protein